MSEEKGGKLSDTLLRLLRGTGRPFSVNALLKELPKDAKKASVEKVLGKLVDSECVVEKTFGKKTLYWAKQSKVDSAKLLEQRNQLSEQIILLDKQLAATEETARKLEAELKPFTSKGKQDPDQKLSGPELDEAIKEQEKRVESLTAQRDRMAAAGGPKKSSKSKAEYEKAWRQRKRIVLDIMGAVLENSETLTKKDIIEQIGLETDEDAGVALP
ncbi:uncharacterized protein LOC135936142 [Cloeon dipterum]|uniref:uncharacterized protein LOC135936142 n=1 Tax=Cloeon dipterum TaxID=197152 RepID=UPI00321F668C